jgi:hypothetical protein
MPTIATALIPRPVQIDTHATFDEAPLFANRIGRADSEPGCRARSERRSGLTMMPTYRPGRMRSCSLTANPGWSAQCRMSESPHRRSLPIQVAYRKSN